MRVMHQVERSNMNIFNFSAGPSMIPHDVMLQAQREFCDWQGTGTSIMEVSHRGQDFIVVAQTSEYHLRNLLNIPDNYHVLFLQGGAQLQFAGIPMNILGDYTRVHYVQTGVWSELAVEEAKKYATVVMAADTSSSRFTTLIPASEWISDADSAYCYYCDNETVHGVEFNSVPDIELPLVCDMSSNLLTRPIDVSRFGLIVACAQKNFGPAGVTVVIVRDDLLQREPRLYTPSVMDYRVQIQKGCMKNTPVTFSWYMTNLVFEWIKEQGGVDVMHERAVKRSSLLYDYIDSSSLYHCPVDVEYRSRMNVVFDLHDESLYERFLSEAKNAGLLYLKGHIARGGLRASMYNAMPIEGAERLVEFMQGFERR